jgi:glycosyltransferase involved in cell wall biosynthesis
VTRAWSRRGNWVGELATAIAASGVDAIHVQHEESHYGQDDRFIGLLERVRARGVRSIVTLHSVYDRRIDLPLRVPGKSFHRRLAATCDRIVVHQRAGCGDVLLAHGVPADRIAVIPHGTPELELPDRTAARARIGIPDDAPTALFFGFIHPGKNLHVALRAFERVRVDLPEAHLVIAGRIRSSGFLDERYAEALWRDMRRGIQAGRIIYKPGFIPTDQKALYFAAADLVLLPHRQRYGSASGVLHEGLAARRAIMCSRGKKFAEAVEVLGEVLPFATPPPGDVDAWEVGMERLLGNHADRVRAVSLVERLADVTSWQASAARHADLYRSVCSATSAR